MHQNQRPGVVIHAIAVIWIGNRMAAVLHDACGIGEPLDRGEAGKRRP